MLYFLNLPIGVTVYPMPTDLGTEWADPTDDRGGPLDWRRSGFGKAARTTVDVAGGTRSITWHRTTPGEVLDYRLSDPAEASPRWPLVRTIEEHAGLPEEDRHHYAARRGAGTTLTRVVDLADGYAPWPIAVTDVPPRPDLPEGSTWTVGTAWADVFGLPDHDHIVPGNLSGFHAAARDLIAAHPHYLPSGFGERGPRIERKGKVETAARVGFTFQHADRLRAPVKRGRGAVGAPLRQTIHVDVTIGPDTVGGETLAGAVEAWTRRLAEVIAQLPGRGYVCATCRGAGFVTDPAHAEPDAPTPETETAEAPPLDVLAALASHPGAGFDLSFDHTGDGWEVTGPTGTGAGTTPTTAVAALIARHAEQARTT